MHDTWLGMALEFVLGYRQSRKFVICESIAECVIEFLVGLLILSIQYVISYYCKQIYFLLLIFEFWFIIRQNIEEKGE